jgi:hypothetical protein
MSAVVIVDFSTATKKSALLMLIARVFPLGVALFACVAKNGACLL